MILTLDSDLIEIFKVFMKSSKYLIYLVFAISASKQEIKLPEAIISDQTQFILNSQNTTKA